jgi:hypothetical protein
VLLPQTNLDVFGRTKASAALYDGLIRGVPVLVPEEMHFSSNFAETYGDSLIPYDDLLVTLEQLASLSEADSRPLFEAAAASAARFTLEEQAERIEREIFAEAVCAR